MTAKFREFMKDGYKFEPATNDIEYVGDEFNTRGIRFFVYDEDNNFIGFLDVVSGSNPKHVVWRYLEGKTKFSKPYIREALDVTGSNNGDIDQEIVKEAVDFVIKNHEKNKSKWIWSWAPATSELSKISFAQSIQEWNQ